MDRPLIGICVFVRRDNKILLHKRKGKHAPGTWACPGGHMELWEDFADTALREMAEEAGLDLKIENIKFWAVSNTRFYDEGRHYVVISLTADWISGEAQVVEPEKCECWQWFAWNELPSPLLMGLQDVVSRNLNPFEN